MADFALSSGSLCRPYRSPWGNFPTNGYNVSTGISSATINIGRVVTLDYTASTTAGRILPSTAGNSSGAHFMTVGIAAELASGSTAVSGVDGIATKISVWEANPFVEFKAVTKGGVLASSNVGQVKALLWDSTLAISYVDLAAATVTARVNITQLIDAEGDSGGYVAFRFLSHLTDNIGSSVALTSTNAVLAFYK